MRTKQKTLWVSLGKCRPEIQEDLASLPDGWRLKTETSVERDIDVPEYTEEEIEDEQIRGDANEGLDLRFRREGNFRDEVTPVKNTKAGKLATQQANRMWSVNHALLAGDADLAMKLNTYPDQADAYFEENH